MVCPLVLSGPVQRTLRTVSFLVEPSFLLTAIVWPLVAVPTNRIPQDPSLSFVYVAVAVDVICLLFLFPLRIHPASSAGIAALVNGHWCVRRGVVNAPCPRLD